MHASLGKLQEMYIHVDPSVERKTASRTGEVSAGKPDEDNAYVSNDGARGEPAVVQCGLRGYQGNALAPFLPLVFGFRALAPRDR